MFYKIFGQSAELITKGIKVLEENCNLIEFVGTSGHFLFSALLFNASALTDIFSWVDF